VLLGALVALVPACSLGGLAFAFAARASTMEGASDAATIYMAETLGAVLAGLLFYFVLAERLASAWIFVLAAAPCLAAGVRLSFPRRKIVAGAAVLVGLALGAMVAPRMTVALAAAHFQGQQVVAMQPSRYGLLAVTARGEQRALFHDGVLLFTSEDEVAAEESVHLPLLLHPRPRRVLLVGGGLGGGLVQILKHRPEQLDYVEIDPGIISLARSFADVQTRAALADARVQAIAVDGRRLLLERPAYYDVIVINLPVPQSALLARFFSDECFRDARRALAPGGLLTLVTPGSDAYLDAGARQRHGHLMATLKAVFPTVGVSPGAQTIFWATSGSIEVQPDILANRLKERGLQLEQVNRAWLFDRLLPLNIAEYRQALATIKPIENRDFHPTVYLFGLVENLQRLSPGLSRVALAFALAPWAPWLVAVVVLAPAVLVVLLRRHRRAPGFAAAVAGAAGMGLQLVLLLAYQALQGHLYHALGGFLALFMAGLAVGAWAGQQAANRQRMLALVCAVMAGTAALVPVVLKLAQAAPSLAPALILLLLIAISALTGATYPLAVRVASQATPHAASAIYAWDLAGSAGAAAFAALVAIPLLGFFPVALLLSALCLAAAWTSY
jgi:spermidine synthase